MGGLQLSVVVYSGQSEFVRSSCINPVLLERLRQRVGLTILVQMNSDSAHRALCGRDGTGSLRAQAVFAFAFAGNLLQVPQRV